ncbi:hypothetical protein BSP15_002 [Bacillus phage BSP15]|nr:hypothetical protein BSP15_002 [Bacillus phage BSP15]
MLTISQSIHYLPIAAPGLGPILAAHLCGSILVAPYDGSIFTFKIGSKLGKKISWKISTRGREVARVPCRLWEKKVRGGV